MCVTYLLRVVINYCLWQAAISSNLGMKACGRLSLDGITLTCSKKNLLCLAYSKPGDACSIHGLVPSTPSDYRYIPVCFYGDTSASTVSRLKKSSDTCPCQLAVTLQVVCSHYIIVASLQRRVFASGMHDWICSEGCCVEGYRRRSVSG